MRRRVFSLNEKWLSHNKVFSLSKALEISNLANFSFNVLWSFFNKNIIFLSPSWSWLSPLAMWWFIVIVCIVASVCFKILTTYKHVLFIAGCRITRQKSKSNSSDKLSYSTNGSIINCLPNFDDMVAVIGIHFWFQNQSLLYAHQNDYRSCIFQYFQL